MVKIESLPALSIRDLMDLGALARGQWIESPIRWGQIRIAIEVNEPEGWVKVRTDRGIQLIDLIRVPSNLGLGYRWYFGCRQSRSNGLKLYLYGSLLLARSGIPGPVYDCQDIPKQFRSLLRGQRLQKVVNTVNKPGYTPYYNGKRTRSHIRFLKAVRELRGWYGTWDQKSGYRGW